MRHFIKCDSSRRRLHIWSGLDISRYLSTTRQWPGPIISGLRCSIHVDEVNFTVLKNIRLHTFNRSTARALIDHKIRCCLSICCDNHFVTTDEIWHLEALDPGWHYDRPLSPPTLDRRGQRSGLRGSVGVEALAGLEWRQGRWGGGQRLLSFNESLWCGPSVCCLYTWVTAPAFTLAVCWRRRRGEEGGSTRHIPGNTFQSAAAAAWRGKAVKAARPLCLPPYGLRCSSPPPSPSYSPAWPPDSAGRRWLSLWSPWTPSRGEAACRGAHGQLCLLPVEQEMSVNRSEMS